ncbi:MAG: hypothetical protein C4345_11045, partial [Chloroflexota bacterium]
MRIAEAMLTASESVRFPYPGCDCNGERVAERAFTRLPLTTFPIPRYEMGVVAMRKLRLLIGGKEEP